MDIVHRKCPICNGAIGSIMKTMEFSLPEDAILPCRYRVTRCTGCGFVYDDVDVGSDSFSRYYELAGKYVQKGIGGSGDISNVDWRRYQDIIDFVESAGVAKSCRIADIGCGKGGLLRVFRENGYADLCGIEPSPGCVDLMRTEYDLDAICTSISHLPLERKFDVVCVSNVFEHLYSLHDAIDSVDSILDEAGLVYVDVPDASRYWKYFYAPYYSFDMEHINHFNVSSMAGLWAQHGYGCLKFEEFVGTPVPGRHIPMCRVLLKKGVKGVPVMPSTQLDDGVLRFIEMSHKAESNIHRLRKIDGDVCYWGCGAYAKWLLKWSEGNDLKLPTCIIDAGVTASGASSICGIPLVSPKDFEHYVSQKSTVIITSVLYERQIASGLACRGWSGGIYSAATGLPIS